MRTVAVIQARLGSSRLPGKVLKPVCGVPMLKLVVSRVRRAHAIDEVVVATTVDTQDDPIVALADREHWPVIRGSPEDLLDRYVEAARAHRADVVVRVTSDCPFIDPEIIDATINVFNGGQCDYASNTLDPRTFPRGLDVEVIARATLERAWLEDSNAASREHVTPYIYQHPELFRLCSYSTVADLAHHRWVVDTPLDYTFVSAVASVLDRDDFTWRDVLDVLAANPGWAEINGSVVQKSPPPRSET